MQGRYPAILTNRRTAVHPTIGGYGAVIPRPRSLFDHHQGLISGRHFNGDAPLGRIDVQHAGGLYGPDLVWYIYRADGRVSAIDSTPASVHGRGAYLTFRGHCP